MASSRRPPPHPSIPAKSSSPAARGAPLASFLPDLSPGIGTRRPRETLSPGDESTKLVHRNSRVDLDFEQALASQDTFRLYESPDIATMGQEADSSFAKGHHSNESGDHTSLTLAQMLASSGGGDSSRPGTATRKLKKAHHPSTPNASTNPHATSPRPNTANSTMQRSPASSSRPSLSEYSSVGGSPAPSHRELPDESGQPVRAVEANHHSRGQEDMKKRSMFRSAGTASSPDLGTVVRKKRDQRRSAPKVPPLPHQANDYDDAVYPSTDAAPSSMSGWTATLSGRNRAQSKGEGKSPRTLRAKTGTFLSNFFSSSPGTTRDRSRSGAGDASHPSTPHKTKYDRPFEDSPPVPVVPHDHRSGPLRIADMFLNSGTTSGGAVPSSKTGKRASKPLPPIVRSSASDASDHRHHPHEMTVSPVDTSRSASASSHASPKATSGPTAPSQRRPIEAISRLQVDSSAGRRRSMSVGDVEQWNKVPPGPASSPKNAEPMRSTSPMPKWSSALTPSARPISSNSTNSGYTTARSDITPPPASAREETPTEAHLSPDWKHALEEWDHQVASLEIKDPSTALKKGEGSPSSSAAKVRPRSKTQGPVSSPAKLSQDKKPSGTIRAGSVGSPPSGFRLPAESSSAPPLSPQPKSPPLRTTSPPAGLSPSSPTFSSTQVTPTKRRSVSPTVPFTGPIIIGTTPASIGYTTTKVTIQRDEPRPMPTSSPKPSTSPSGSGSAHSSPIALSSSRPQSPRASAAQRPSSPPAGRSAAMANSASLRASSLRTQTRPTIHILGAPSSPVLGPVPGPNAASVLRNTPSLSSSLTSQKPSLSLTSPSQENLRFVGTSATATAGGSGGSRMHELRMYGMRNAASASEPTLVPPGGGAGGVSVHGVDDSVKTIRLITSGSRLGSGSSGIRGGDSLVGENGEILSVTRISSPTSSVKHAFSNASTGTSVGRSSVSRDGSVGTMNGSGAGGSVLALEEMEAKSEAIARRIWEEDETFKSKERFSEWLGQPDPLNAMARRYYMDHFDFTGLRLDNAFRRLCSKLFLRAESQVLDRILIEFSRRYWEHNPNCVLGSASNVHQVVYSLLLLNTDLHVADLAHHMTKQQFIANTLSTLVGPSRTSSSAPTPARSGSPIQDELARKASLEPMTTPTTNFAEKNERSGPPISIQNPTLRVKRSGSVTSWKGSLSRDGGKEGIHIGTPPHTQTIPSHPSTQSAAPASSPSGTITENSSLNGSTVSFHETTAARRHNSGQASVTSLPIGSQKAWENDVEAYLKDIYNAVRSNQILQPVGTGSGGLSPGSSLGRGASQRRNANTIGPSKRSSMRGFPAFVTAQQGINSSTSSVDGRLSPSPSFATSINDGMVASSSVILTPALGFASNLTHTIIREAQEDDQRSLNSDASASSDVSISDEELALLGAPWAKEGVLQRKQYWESTGKRSKNKNWMEVFVVIQKGQLNMFTFGGTSSGNAGPSSGVVGGGNWLNNAQSVGEHMLAHSLAHVLPPPGLARRPHCFVLTLASGMGFFFQAGTEELANEWVSTCNYWAARQSKEPLASGVSNMEYGWSRVESEALAADDYDGPPESVRGLSIKDSSDSFSLRSGRSRTGVRFDGFGTMRSNPFTDRVYINDWRAPGHSTVASNHDEETQLEALQRQADKLTAEFKKHNDLREPMISLYAPKSNNLAKAMMNWEARSQYLHTEIVKYEKYIESLRSAMKERLRRRGEKALERALSASSSSAVTPGPNQRGFELGENEARGESQETAGEALTPGANRLQFQ